MPFRFTVVAWRSLDVNDSGRGCLGRSRDGGSKISVAVVTHSVGDFTGARIWCSVESPPRHRLP